MCEIGMVYGEISYMLNHLKKFSREKRVTTPLAQTYSRSFVKPSPKGVVLIISPWNYPFMLTLEPLVDALAAGNTAVLKTGAYAANTCDIIEKIVLEALSPDLVAVVKGGREENRTLLEQKFDHIFFTGSQNVGKEVLRKAAENLTPATLELGGKSPCIVDKTADIDLAARRIVFGKFLNCGQTCVAPDYICCHKSKVKELISALKKEIIRQYGENPLTNSAYGKIINQKHFMRLSNLLDESCIYYGGKFDENSLKIEPSLAYPCAWEDKIMEEEIFGPILPIITYENEDKLISKINSLPHPLALYIFTSDNAKAKKFTSLCPFGGGCINDTVIHLATSNMGFGGFGASGMGAYHGKAGFDNFSHYKSIVDKKTWLDLPMRYQPYSKLSEKIIRIFMR